MNNATLALNVSRPAAPATPSPTGRDKDDAPSSKRFDAALDAAHANARDPRDADTQTHQSHPSHAPAPDNDPASSAKAADAQKGDRKADDDSGKKDESDGGDTSIAATMLSLIGVPPKVTEVAAKVLDTAKGATGDTPGAPTTMLGVLPGTAGLPAALAGVLPGTAAGVHAAADSVAGLGDAMASLPGTASLATTAAVAVAVAAPTFDSLLAAQGIGGAASKDGASSLDPANPSPMPFAHPQALGATDAPVVQVQATQAATSPQFAQELGEQIAWMGSGDVKEARIKLHPEELGSMDVRVNMDGGKVNVAIMAQHPAAVHAVQQTLSQLDSMLAHHGLSLGQADVGQRQAEQGGEGGANGTATQQGSGDAVVDAETVAVTRVSRGLVDEVA